MLIEGIGLLITSLSFGLIMLFLIIGFPEIKKEFKKINQNTWILILIIFLIGAGIRFALPHANFIYSSEYSDLQAGKNILLHGKAELCEYEDFELLKCYSYKKMIGGPLLFAMAFSIFGVDNFVAINVATLFGSLSIFLMFLIGYLIFNERIAILSALFMALSPLHIFFSLSASIYIIGLFFVLLTIFAFLIFFKNKNTKVLILGALSIAFSIQILAELVLLIPLVIFMFFIFEKDLKKKVRNYKFWIPPLVSFIFFFLAFLQLSGNFYLISSVENKNIFENLIKMLQYTYEIHFFNLPFMPFPIFFICFSMYSFLNHRRKTVLIFFWFILFFSFYLFSHFIQLNIFLLFCPALALVNASGISFISGKIKKNSAFVFFAILLTILPFSMFNFYYFFQSQLKLETDIVNEIKNDIPENCYLIVANPTVFRSTSDVKAINIEKALDNKFIIYLEKKTDCIMFLSDVYCFFEDYNYSKIYQGDYCGSVIDLYELRSFKQYKKDKIYLYTVYNLSTKSATL
ncbi:MAG: glycosyltransferase family 39 protein [archaeon]|nr:MAG: glycosyltransferase family 39 protein [archaeon]